ncbi:MAG: hypothetical protein SH809_15325 [Rhodothermales bacterium]|nr:hypothetical protein [Rhodothermales bacterium]
MPNLSRPEWALRRCDLCGAGNNTPAVAFNLLPIHPSPSAILAMKHTTIWLFLTVFVVVLGGALVGGWWWVKQTVDAPFVERRINEALAEAGSNYRASVGEVTLSLFQRSVAVEDLALIADSSAGEPRLTVVAPRLAISGIRITPYVFNRRIDLHNIELEGAELLYEAGESLPDSTGGEGAPPDSLAETGTLTQRLARQLPEIAIGQIALRDLTVVYQPAGDGRRQRVAGIDIAMDDIAVDSTSALDTTRVLFSRDIRLLLAPQAFAAPDSLHLFSVGAIEASTRDSFVRIDSFVVTPTVSEEEFSRRIAFRRDRMGSGIAGIRLEGLDVKTFLEGRAFRAGGLAIDSAFLDVYKNKQVAEDPNKTTPLLPHEALQAIGIPVFLDSVAIRTADIVYRELEEDGALEGVVRFERVNLIGYRINSEPDTSLAGGGAALLYARAIFQGAGQLLVAFELPLHGSTFAMRYHGTLSAMPADPVSPLLTNLKGIRIQSGQVDSLAFDIRVTDAQADGEVRVGYHDLKMDFVDKTDRSKRFQDRLKTFFVNGLLIHDSNPAGPNDSLRVGTTAYVRDEDPFFRFLWRALRDGLKESVNR